jgi:GNAT superfamily N-acetyltransferase
MDAYDFNFVHALGLFASTSKSGEAFETREFLLTNSKGKVAEFNQAFLKQPYYKLARALDRMQAFYARAEVPFRLCVPVEEPDINAALQARGFVRQRDLPMMLLQQGAPALWAPRQLHVREAREASIRADFQRVAFESFGYPLQLAALALTDDLLTLGHVTAFVGYLDGEACASSMLITTGDVAGIYWVGTVAGARGKGFGAAVTAHAAAEGLARGARHVCLQASAMGAPVYERMGFAVARTYAVFNHG